MTASLEVGTIVRVVDSTTCGEVRGMFIENGIVRKYLVALPDPKEPGMFEVHSVAPARVRAVELA